MAYQSKKYRKFVATAATATLVATAVAPAAGFAAEKDFKDSIPNWAADAVQYLVGKGAIEGYPDGSFGPSDSLTRAQAAKILALALDIEIDPNAKSNFSDVKDTHWANQYIAAIQKAKPGVIEGYNGKFNPSADITRQEMAKMVVTAYGFEKDESAVINFTDNNGWGKAEIEVLASLGVVQGVATGTFGPNQKVTRAQAATFVHRAEVPSERLPVETTEAKVVSVSAIDATNLKVTLGGNLKDLTITSEDFEVKVDGEKVDFTVVKESETEYTLKLAIPLNDGAKVEVVGLSDLKDSSASTTYSPIAITKVEAVATTVLHDKDGQFLKLKVNGVEKTASELAAQGYSVSFVASKDVFGASTATSTTGELDEGQLNTILSADKQFTFSYKVSVQKNNSVVTSESAEVLVIDSESTAISAIKSIELGDVAAVAVNNDATSASYTIDTLTRNQLVVGETVDFEKVVATLADGRQDIDLIATTGNVSYTSSDVRLATISGNTLTAKGVGTVTVTVKSGNYSKDVTFQIVSAPRKLTTATVSRTSLNLAHGAAVPVSVTLKDQYGQTFGAKTDLVVTEAKNTSGTEITATTAAGGTDDTKNGLFYYTITAETGVTGAGKVEFNHANSAKLASTSVNVGAAASTTQFKLELNRTNIDLNPTTTAGSITFRLNEYGAAGQFVGTANLDDYTVEIFDADGKKIANTTGTNLDGTDAADDGIYTLSRAMLITEDAAVAAPTGTAPDIANYETGNGLIKVTDTATGDVYSANFTITDSAPTVNSATFLDGFEIKAGVNVTAPLSTFLTKVGTTASAGDGVLRYVVDGTDDNIVHMYYETANTADGYTFASDVYLGRVETNFVSGDNTAVLDFTGSPVTFSATAGSENATFQFDVVKRGAASTATSVAKKNIVVKP